MKKKILLFLVPLMLVCTVVSAQKGKPAQEIKPGKPNSLDNQYNPGNNTSLTGGTTTGSSGGTTPEYRNVVKMNFALFVRSTFAVHYQRKITDDFSVQGGVGYCYGTDRASLLSGSGGDFNLGQQTKSLITLGVIQEYGTFSQGANPFLAASVRFNFNGFYSYYYGTGDGNSYLDLGIRYVGQHYNLTTLGNNAQATITGDGHIPVRNTWYTLTYGYQLEAGSKLITTHEFYVGTGIRKTSYNVFQQTQVYTPNGNYVDTYAKTSQREKVFTIAVMIGYVLGFGF